MKEKILVAIESPKELETLYQQDPAEFQQVFPEVFTQHSNFLILQVWHERINYQHSAKSQQRTEIWSYRNILLVIFLSIITGTIVKLPQFIQAIDEGWFYTKNLAGTIIISLMIYFFFQRNHPRRSLVIVLAIGAVALLYLNLLPGEYGFDSYEFSMKYRSFSDALAVAHLHIPLFLWLLLGVAIDSKNWKETTERMNYLRYNGELIIYTTMILIGGMVLTGITLALLSLVENSYELSSWYQENVIVYGAVAAPIVATFLIEKLISSRLNIAPILAKIFTPLFLLTTIAYLIIMVIYQKSPFDVRDTLVAFNALLIIVLGLSMFSIAERNPGASSGISDYMNIGLIFATLVIDLIALSAVLFRLTNDVYGLTPNRIAILGINLLVFCHLVGIFLYYVRFISNKSSFIKLENWITRFLPVYAAWAVVISVALPLIFWYR